MSVFGWISNWANRYKSKRWWEKVVVSFDEDNIVIVADPTLNKAWNQECRWRDIERVCLKDEGLYSTDLIFLEIKGSNDPVTIPVEAVGAQAMYNEICERGLIPAEVGLLAIRETKGATHCWPPKFH